MYRWCIGLSEYRIRIGYRYSTSVKYQGNVARQLRVRRRATDHELEVLFGPFERLHDLAPDERVPTKT
jgi:hypothetical protein